MSVSIYIIQSWSLIKLTYTSIRIYAVYKLIKSIPVFIWCTVHCTIRMHALLDLFTSKITTQNRYICCILYILQYSTPTRHQNKVDYIALHKGIRTCAASVYGVLCTVHKLLRWSTTRKTLSLAIYRRQSIWPLTLPWKRRWAWGCGQSTVDRVAGWRWMSRETIYIPGVDIWHDPDVSSLRSFCRQIHVYTWLFCTGESCRESRGYIVHST
jgi:hypothetical protein